MSLRERRLRGIPGSPGVALGQITHHAPAPSALPSSSIPPTQVPAEIARLRMAIAHVQERILASLAAAHAGAGSAEAAIFEAHALMLEDPALIDAAADRIAEQLEPAAKAVRAVADELLRQFAGIEDAYLRERAADLEDVASQIVRAVTEPETAHADLPARRARGVVVAAELFPSDTALFDPARVAGFATERGGRLGHVAILARALGIPAVLGLQGALAASQPGELALLDGDDGLLILSPEPATLAHFADRLAAAPARPSAETPVAPIDARTLDGAPITLRANAGSLAEVQAAHAAGADGVGLLRTEFLFLGRGSLPDEDEQVAAYRRAARIMAGRSVVIRLLDAGGDKPLPGLVPPRQQNSALGPRGLRLLLAQPELLRTQLRAVLRAATAGPLALLIPMVATRDDLRQARRALDLARAELAAEGLEHRPHVPVGIMIEVPSAAVIADLLIQEVDFFSIGTNDLTQYTLAVDRADEPLTGQRQPLDPAVLRLIDRAVSAALQAGKPVSVCGELAGDPQAIGALIGLGIRELSMSPSSLAPAVDLIASIRADAAAELVQRCLAGDDHE